MKRALLIAMTFVVTACMADDSPLDVSIDPPGTIDAQAPDFGLPNNALVDSGNADAAADMPATSCPVGLRPSGSDCVSAVPTDPTFSDPLAWTTFGGAEVGEGLQLDRGAICEPGGSGATTTLDIGTYDDVGPLFVTVDLQYDLCDDPGVGQCEPSSILFARIGESVIQIPTPFGLAQPQRSVSFCLPSRAYGRKSELDIWFREFESDACADPDTRTVAEAIRSVRIAQVGETVCPAPGVFDDPGFERSFPDEEPVGWVVNKGGTGDVSVRGSDLDRETVISLNTGCSNAQMQQTIRVPTPVDSSNGIALQFDQDMTQGTPLQVRVGPFQRYLVDLVPGPRPLCIPTYLWGRAEQLLFRVTGTTDCTESLGYRAVIDDLEFVELPECGPAGVIRDGQFRGDLLTTWNATTSDDDATIQVNAQGELTLLSTRTCGAATAEQWVTPRQENALRFRYRATAEGEHAVISRTLGFPSIDPTTLPATPELTEQVFCLPDEPRLPVNVSFTEFAASMTCGAPAATSLELDDVELIRDPACD